MSKQVTAFKCDYCGRIFKSKSAATRHEKFCSYNPANQFKCFYCKFLKVQTEFIETSEDELPYKSTLFICTELKLALHTHKAVQRNLTEVLKTTELMRLKCDSFKSGIHYTRDIL